MCGQCAMVDVEGGSWFEWDFGLIEDGPVVLGNAAIGGAVTEECREFGAVAGNAEVADDLLCDGFVEEVVERGVGEVGGFGFVEEQEIDVRSAQGAEAAVE